VNLYSAVTTVTPYALMTDAKTVKGISFSEMPNYDYECSKCLKISTFNYGVNDRPPQVECADCGVQLTRKIKFGGVAFNGSGFYSNDKKER